MHAVALRSRGAARENAREGNASLFFCYKTAAPKTQHSPKPFPSSPPFPGRPSSFTALVYPLCRAVGALRSCRGNRPAEWGIL